MVLSVPKNENLVFPRHTGKEVFASGTEKHQHSPLARLLLEESRQIYLMLGREMSALEIAKKLNWHHFTIYREINRNMF